MYLFSSNGRYYLGTSWSHKLATRCLLRSIRMCLPCTKCIPQGWIKVHHWCIFLTSYSIQRVPCSFYVMCTCKYAPHCTTAASAIVLYLVLRSWPVREESPVVFRLVQLCALSAYGSTETAAWLVSVVLWIWPANMKDQISIASCRTCSVVFSVFATRSLAWQVTIGKFKTHTPTYYCI